MTKVIPFPQRGEVRLDKKRLSFVLGKSTRWIERRNFPSEMREGKRVYVLRTVLAAMDEEKAS